MRMFTGLLFAVCSLVVVGSLLAQEPEKKPSVWMRTKLEHSQKILDGLATADFDAIASHAKSMHTLTELEKHVRAGAPGYRTQLQFFRHATEDMVKQANKKNLDGCAIAFQQMTLSCINCHKVLRDKE
ncbi:MAG TPA: hypothetical protein VL096_15910 [Pirellulaceae bacterium]|nr:hypothetical protein [Pirellulaceae bacterium]